MEVEVFFSNGGWSEAVKDIQTELFKRPGELDASCMDAAPLNIFENQVMYGIAYFSKTFKPNVTTTRVFLLGMKFFPV